VLVPIVRRPQPGLLLTQRSPLMRKHAGQVAFPGGAVDNTDATLIAAALREAQEEVAIPPESVEVIGVLPPVDSVTGFQVTPVVGLFRPICTITPARMKSPRCLKCRWPKRCAWALPSAGYPPPRQFASRLALLVSALFCLGNDRRHYSRAGAADRRPSLAILKLRRRSQH
jgi:8-oxo-dGTP pyrophosphatase MutT (NUDIX family)